MAARGLVAGLDLVVEEVPVARVALVAARVRALVVQAGVVVPVAEGGPQAAEVSGQVVVGRAPVVPELAVEAGLEVVVARGPALVVPEGVAEPAALEADLGVRAEVEGLEPAGQ